MQALQDGKRPQLVIVGAGIAGLSLAYKLSQAPISITILEAGKIAQQGASAVPLALLNPFRGRSGRASEGDLAGLRAMWALVDELDALTVSHGLRRSGVLRIPSNARQQRKWRKHEGLRYLEQANEAYHTPFGAFLAEQGGWLQPERLLTQLAKVLSARGVSILEQHRVTAIEAGQPQRLHMQTGVIEADATVLCLGTGEVKGVRLPKLEHVAGDVIAIELPDPLPYPIAGAVYGMKVDGLFFLGGNHRPAGQDDKHAPQLLQSAASWFIPALKDQAVQGIWTGVRAKQEGQQPLVQELQPRLWFYGALAGRGFLCSAHLSEILARQIMVQLSVPHI